MRMVRGPVALPSLFTPLPAGEAPRLHVFQGRKLHLESRTDGLSQMFQFPVEHVDRASRNKLPHVDAPVRWHPGIEGFSKRRFYDAF